MTMTRLSIIAAVIALLGCDKPESQQAPAEVLPSVATSSAETANTSVARGVVVEKVPEISALAKAGIQPGDLLLTWKRLPNPPANPEPAEGVLDSPFDFHDLRLEQAPRGAVEISGEREGSEKMWRIEPGSWRDVEVRPAWTGEHLKLYRHGQQQMEDGNLEEGAEAWLELEDRLGREEKERQRLWVHFELACFWVDSSREQPHMLENRENILDLLKAPTIHRLEFAYVQAELGEVLWQGGALDQAHNLHTRALEIRQRLHPKSLRVAYSLNYLGTLAWRRGDLEQAQEHHSRALRLREQFAPGSLQVANSLTSVGNLAWNHDDLDQAYRFYSRALGIYRRLAPTSLQLAGSLNNLGVVAGRRGDLEHAQEYSGQALRLFEQLNPAGPQVVIGYTNLGNLARNRSDLNQAQEYYNRALRIQEQIAPASLQAGSILNNLGALAADRRDLEQARKYYSRALALLMSLTPASLDASATLIGLGNLARDRGDLEQAQELFSRALQIQEQLSPKGLLVAFSLHNLGGVARDRGDLEQAQEFFSRALQIRQGLAPQNYFAADSLRRLAETMLAQGDSNRASTVYLQALEVLEQQIDNLGGSYSVQADFRTQQRKFYLETFELLLAQERSTKAFHILERFRARTFLTMLAERDIAFTADLPEEFDRERRRLAVRRDRTLKKLAGLSVTEGEEEVATIRQELEAMERERGEIEEQIRRASPRLAALQYPEPLTAEAAREALDPGTLLLSYVVGEESTRIFALSREGNLEVKTSPVGEKSLREQIVRMRKLIEEPASTRLSKARIRPLKKVSRELFNVLLEPLAERIEKSERLLILPDGPLHALPFAALIRENGAEDGGDQYLVEWKPFHLALSMTTYAELKKDRPATREPKATSMQLAAFGDPSYPQSFTLSDAEARAAAVPPDAALRSVAGRDLGYDWPPLPYTRREIEGIVELFPQGQVQTFLGPEALEEHVKTLDSGIRILHLAAHSFTDDHLPLSSFVALTIPEDLPEGRDNGLLQAWEILEQVRIKADLVVLSGCLTGMGQELRGEGLIGLTRAFHYAGARSLISTLWSVKDQVTAELMIRFYRHLSSGLPKDEALRAAQLQMLREPISSVDEKGEPVELAHASHPASWSGVQLYGDWR